MSSSRHHSRSPQRHSGRLHFRMLGMWPGGGMIGSVIMAFIGAVILVGLTRLTKIRLKRFMPMAPRLLGDAFNSLVHSFGS
jgi:hypothetical protein